MSSTYTPSATFATFRCESDPRGGGRDGCGYMAASVLPEPDEPNLWPCCPTCSNAALSLVQVVATVAIPGRAITSELAGGFVRNLAAALQ